MSCQSRGDAGFALVIVLFAVLLVTSLGLYLCLENSNRWEEANSLQTQLYSLILAENGIEYARTLLPQVAINDLLAGADGQRDAVADPEWRNPLPFEEARRLTPESWAVERDDGWPCYGGELLMPKGRRAAGDGYFYVRFSNDRGEAPDEDANGVVIVRSLGLTPSRPGGLFHPDRRNDVSMVEAVLRQERVFDLPAPLVLFGDDADFDWQSADFLFDGASHPGVLVISGSAADGDCALQTGLETSLDPVTSQNLKGAGLSPSLLSATDMYANSPMLNSVFSPEFWRHFHEHVSNFTDTEQPGLFYYPAGGALSGEFQGLLVAAGDFELSNIEFRGVLIHIGGGRLTLGEGTTVRGGIWMSDTGGDKELEHGKLELTVTGSVSVTYDPDEIRTAVALLPPTQLGWRILFPEMQL